MKKLVLPLLSIIALILTLVVLTKTFKIPNLQYYDRTDSYLYTRGNAPDATRQEILEQLSDFQKGYTDRDVNVLDDYMDSLFSRDNLLVLGTMPNEYFTNYTEATDLISSDWLYWGDVKLQIDNSYISAEDNVAWFATIGYVEFDMFKYLVVPLRVTGILVNKDNSWRFKQVQYQFDVDYNMILVTIILLTLIIFIMVIRFVILIVQLYRKKG